MWFEKAAQQGHAGAQFNLGHIYRSGNDVPRDGKQAVVWYERAAAQGNGQAMLSLALVYDAGESVAVDKAKAIYWYEQAGQRGIAQACGNLAVMYLTGTDVQQDPFTGMVWSLLSVRAGERFDDPNQSRFLQQWNLLATKVSAELRAQVEGAANEFEAKHWSQLPTG